MPKPEKKTRVIRTSVLLPEDQLSEMRRLAKEGNRPLAREFRQAVADHIERVKEAA